MLGPWHRPGHPSHHCMEIGRVTNPPPPSRQKGAVQPPSHKPALGLVCMFLSSDLPPAAILSRQLTTQEWFRTSGFSIMFLPSRALLETHTHSESSHPSSAAQNPIVHSWFESSEGRAAGGTGNNYYNYMLINCSSNNIEPKSY